MAESFTYRTIDRPGFAEFRDRGSRFLAYAYPVESIPAFKQHLAALKKEHPKAVHHCVAYRIGFDGATFRVSDDGEPSGSAGRPILGQIDSHVLTNTAIIVVRYFGGTLLGVPGLINAYRTATSMAIASVSIVERPVLVHYRLQFDYTQMNEVMRVLKQFDCVVEKQDLQLFCSMEIGVPLQIKSIVENQLGHWILA